MKLKDVFSAVGDHTDWIKFDCDYDILGCKIVPIFAYDIDITLDSDIEIGYQWFHHCNPDLDLEEISKAIEKHNYGTFCKWYNELENGYLDYFPSDATIYIDDKAIGSVCVVYNPWVFNLITWEDHECG